jgi:hypothetical protein
MVAPRAWLIDYRIFGLLKKVRKIIDTTGEYLAVERTVVLRLKRVSLMLHKKAPPVS